MIGGVMLCGVGSTCYCNSLALTCCFSVLTTYVCIQLSRLTHSNAIVSVCIDLNAVMFAQCEHCIPFAT